MSSKKLNKKSGYETVIVGEHSYQFESEEIGYHCPAPLDGHDDYPDLDVQLPDWFIEDHSPCQIKEKYDGEYVFRAHFYAPYENNDDEVASQWPDLVFTFHLSVTYDSSYNGADLMHIRNVLRCSPRFVVYTSNQKHSIWSQNAQQTDLLLRPICDAFIATIKLQKPKCIDYLKSRELVARFSPANGTGTTITVREDHMHMPIVLEVCAALRNKRKCCFCARTLEFSRKFFSNKRNEMYKFHSHPCGRCRHASRSKRKLEEYEEEIKKLQKLHHRLSEFGQFDCDSSDSDTDEKYIICNKPIKP